MAAVLEGSKLDGKNNVDCFSQLVELMTLHCFSGNRREGSKV